MYCMIFAPLTGKNINEKSICCRFFISGEHADSFSWLFEKFIDCMGSALSLIITDQDVGMKAAIECELVRTRHQWCM